MGWIGLLFEHRDWRGRTHQNPLSFWWPIFFLGTASRRSAVIILGSRSRSKLLFKTTAISHRLTYSPYGIIEIAMIEIAKGNLLEARVEALVNTVNTQIYGERYRSAI